MNGTSGATNNGYEGIAQLPIELPLLQQHAATNNNGHQGFYPSYYTDPGTPSTASSGTYPSLIPTYNPYSMTPQLEFIFQGYPWHFAAAVDIGGEVPLPSIDPSQTVTTAPLLSQTLSPLHSANSTSAVAAAMTRYSTRTSQNPRKGGRRPREEYDPPALNEEDKEKRDKRRQRNKEAAARCRQRRLDLMQSLQIDKERLEGQNNELEMRYNTLKKGMEDMIQSLKNHTTNCQVRDELMQNLDIIQNTLRGGPSSFQNSMRHMPPLVNVPASTMLPPINPPKRKIENIPLEFQPQPSRINRPTSLSLGGKALKDHDSLISPSSSFEDAMLYDSPGVKRQKLDDESPLERPSTLSLIQSWGQTPAIVTPSNIMSQFTECVKSDFPEEYSMLNQQTFLTPVVPSAISVSTASTVPPQSDDLQDL